MPLFLILSLYLIGSLLAAGAAAMGNHRRRA
jgi:hypothetical protein